MASQLPTDLEIDAAFEDGDTPRRRRRRRVTYASPIVSVDEIDRAMSESNVSRARETIALEGTRDPVQVQGAQRLGRELGQAPWLVEQNPSDYRQQAEISTAQTLVGMYPEMAPWLTNRDNAAASRLDLKALGGVIDVLRPWSPQEQADYMNRLAGERIIPDPVNVRGALGMDSGDVLGLPSIDTGAIRRGEGQRTGRSPTLRNPLRQERVRRALEEEDRRQVIEFIDSTGAMPSFAPTARTVDTFDRIVRSVDVRATEAITSAERFIAESTGTISEADTDRFNQSQRRAARRVEALRPKDLNTFGEGLFSAGESLGLLALGAGTGQPLAFLSGVSGFDFYGRARERGASFTESALGGLAVGTIEAATEILPLRLLNDAFGGQATRHFLTKFLVADVIGEQIATATQDLVDVAVPGGMTFQEYLDTARERHLQTLIASVAMSGAVGGPAAVVNRLAPTRRDADEIRVAIDGQATVEQLIEQARSTEMATNNPEGFREFVDQMVEQTGAPIRDVFVPVEVLQTYAQTEGADLVFLEPYQDQIAAARQTGGDVVIPLGDAVTRLANSKAWEAIKDDIRVTQGGFTVREAREQAADVLRTLEQRATEIVEETKTNAKARSDFQQMAERYAGQFEAGGAAKEVARANAAIHASFMIATAERAGRTVAELEKLIPITVRKAKKGKGKRGKAKAAPTREVLTWRDIAPEQKGVRTSTPERTAAFVSRVEKAIAAGNDVTLVADGKRVQIVSVENGIMKDAQGQTWGTLALATGEEETNRVEIAPRTVNQGVQGQTDILADGQYVITLFATANQSTLIHELGHTYLEIMFKLAADPAVSQELKDDVEKIGNWFAAQGHPVEAGTIPTEAHELWARGIERYVMEGKAPTKGLRAAFNNFAKWLKDIYLSVEALRAPITPEIREVMRRMIGTQEALDAFAGQSGTTPMTQEELGMTDAEFAAYEASVQNARDTAYDTMLERMMRSLRNREKERLRTRRAEVEAEVTAEVNDMPLFVARHLLRTGYRLGQPDTPRQDIKLNSGWLIDTFGEDVLGRLPRGPQMYRGDGLPGDIVAEMVGADSGTALVEGLIALRLRTEALRAAGEQRDPRELMIDEEVDKRMAQAEDDILTEEQLREEAIASLNTAAQGEVIGAELEALRRRAPARDNPNQRTPYQVAREWARRKVYGERIRDVAGRQAIQRYIRAINKAQRLAEEAIRKGEIDAAFKHKQEQLLNHALLAEAKAAADLVDRIVARMQRLSKRKAMQSVDQDYFDRVHELLERFDFRPRTQKLLDEKDSFEAWAATRQAEGFEVATPPRLAGIGEHWSRVTVDDLTALDDAVKSIMHLGRLKQKLIDAQGERDFNEVRDETIGNMAGLRDANLPDIGDNQTRPLNNLLAGGFKIETIADWLDNGDANGPWNRLIVQGATQAENLKAELQEKFLTPIAEAFRAIPARVRRTLQDKVEAQNLTWNTVNEGDTRKGQRVSLSRLGWITVALNLGNISNAEKMVAGEGWGSVQAVQDEANAILTKEEWDFVHSMWRQFDGLWPEIVRVERELSGLVPEEVIARVVETPFGPYQGGYWKVVFDVSRSKVAEKNEIDAADDLFGLRSGVGTPKGHIIARTGAVGPLTYRFEEIIQSHLDRVTTRIAYAQWAREVLRFIGDAKISGMVKTKIGGELEAQLLPWLRRVVNGNQIDKRGAAGLDKWLRTFRVNQTVVAMGFAFSTGLAQTLGLGFSTGRIGAKYVALGLKRSMGLGGGVGSLAGGAAGFALAGPLGVPAGLAFGSMAGGFLGGLQKAQDFVFSRSEEMQRRATAMSREVTDVMQDLNSLPVAPAKKTKVDRLVHPLRRAKAKAGRGITKTQALAFWHIAMIDRYMVSMPTWLGAHQKGLDEGMTDAQASAYADKIVRTSQGSGREKDLSAWQSPNSEAMRFLVMFYTPFSVQFNAQADMIHQVRNGKSLAAAQMFFWFIVATALADAMMAGDWPEDEGEDGQVGADDLASWFGRNVFFSLFQGMPVLRDGATLAERQITGRYANIESPVSQTLETLWKAGGNFNKIFIEGDKELDGASIKQFSQAVGLTLGLPTGQIGKTSGFIYDVNNGAINPEDFRDWFVGLTYGSMPEREGDRR